MLIHRRRTDDDRMALDEAVFGFCDQFLEQRFLFLVEWGSQKTPDRIQPAFCSSSQAAARISRGLVVP